MTTPRIRSLVSLAAVLTFTVALGGCASSNSRLAAGESVQSDTPPLTFRFDNESRDYVHVYLVGVRQEWPLGRVAPGARSILRIPEAALIEDFGTMRLAVLEGQRAVLRASGDARAEFTIPLAAASIATQRWSFSPLLSRGQQLTAIPIGRSTAEAGRP